MTEPNSHRPVRARQSGELDRAMLSDRIALLERQLESAERQVRNAEEGARHAQSALAAALLTKARDQKSELGADDGRADEASQRSDSSVVSEDAADALRREYEQRFRVARERLAQEFQERLDIAKAAWEADAARGARRVPDTGLNLLPGRLIPFFKSDPANGKPVQKLAPALPYAFFRLLESRGQKAAVVLLAVAATVGAFLGWSVTTDKHAPSGPAPSVAIAPPPETIGPVPSTPAPAAVTSAPASVPQAEPALPSATDMPVATPPDNIDKPQASDPVPEPAGPAQALQTPAPVAAGQQPVTPEPSVAPLQEELNGLRERLDAATKRARLAEETLRVERRKAAAVQTRRMPTASREPEPALPRVAAPSQVPEQVSDPASLPDRRSGRFQPAE
jgi:hypothetical protein